MAIPVLVVGAMLGVGRGWPALFASLLAALGLYVVCSWLVEPLVVGGVLPGWLFGFWAIPLYGLLTLAAFGLAIIHEPGSGHPRPSSS